MATGFLTKRSVNAFAADGKQALLWDAGDGSTKGFGLLAMPSGSKSYVFQYRIGGRAGRTRRYTIGKHGLDCTVDQARARAKELAADVMRGIDPIERERDCIRAETKKRTAREAAERLERELAFSSYAERFLKCGIDADTRPRTRAGYAGALRNHVVPVLGSTPLPAIAKRDIRRAIDRIDAGKPAVRRIVFATLRMLFKWAVEGGDIAASPMDGMAQPAAAPSRDRVLSDDELAMVLRAAAAMPYPFGPLIELLFATGQRRDEVGGLRWEEVDRATATWTLPAARAKNDTAHIVPLNAFAIAIIDRVAGGEAWPRRGYVFTTTGHSPISGYSKAKAAFDARVAALIAKDAETAPEGAMDAIAPWRLHDARRTLATGLQRLGVRLEVTEAVLNHVSGKSRSGIVGVYQRHDWREEKRAALDAWAKHIDAVLHSAPATGNVVPLRPAGAA